MYLLDALELLLALLCHVTNGAEDFCYEHHREDHVEARKQLARVGCDGHVAIADGGGLRS